MAEEKKNAPVVIDAEAFDPVPRNTLRYGGNDHPAFDLFQVPNSVRERAVRLEQHLTACKTVDEQAAFLVGLISAFAPSVPGDLLRDEPLEKLIGILNGLALAGIEPEKRPTTGQRKSVSRRNTRR